jgi:hypothetical protein
MSKRKLADATLTITLSPAPRPHGNYEARLEGDDRILCVSSTPFCDAARQLIAEGYDSRAILVLRHAGSDEDCLRANLRTAASLTVEETKYGPRFSLWKPMPALAAAPGITPIE